MRAPYKASCEMSHIVTIRISVVDNFLELDQARERSTTFLSNLPDLSNISADVFLDTMLSVTDLGCLTSRDFSTWWGVQITQ